MEETRGADFRFGVDVFLLLAERFIVLPLERDAETPRLLDCLPLICIYYATVILLDVLEVALFVFANF